MLGLHPIIDFCWQSQSKCAILLNLIQQLCTLLYLPDDENAFTIGRHLSYFTIYLRLTLGALDLANVFSLLISVFFSSRTQQSLLS